MINSMTGYGRAEKSDLKSKISVEIRSVNNRFLDFNIRAGRNFLFLEEKIREYVSKYISRGKVDIFVNLEKYNLDNGEIEINEGLAGAYINAMSAISEKFNIKNDISASFLAKSPDVFNVIKQETDNDAVWNEIKEILENALTEFCAMRKREGQRLLENLKEIIENIKANVFVVRERMPLIVEEYRQRLFAKLKETLENTAIDESRILTEAAIFSDKACTDEETVRLISHIDEFYNMLSNTSPVGKRMDFLIQEINREVNTIGSKCNDLATTKIVVELKADIEKLREQVQNIE